MRIGRSPPNKSQAAEEDKRFNSVVLPRLFRDKKAEDNSKGNNNSINRKRLRKTRRKASKFSKREEMDKGCKAKSWEDPLKPESNSNRREKEERKVGKLKHRDKDTREGAPLRRVGVRISMQCNCNYKERMIPEEGPRLTQMNPVRRTSNTRRRSRLGSRRIMMRDTLGLSTWTEPRLVSLYQRTQSTILSISTRAASRNSRKWKAKTSKAGLLLLKRSSPEKKTSKLSSLERVDASSCSLPKETSTIFPEVKNQKRDSHSRNLHNSKQLRSTKKACPEPLPQNERP